MAGLMADASEIFAGRMIYIVKLHQIVYRVPYWNYTQEYLATDCQFQGVGEQLAHYG